MNIVVERVEMHKRVQGQAPLVASGRVAKSPRHPRVRELVQRQAHEHDRKQEKRVDVHLGFEELSRSTSSSGGAPVELAVELGAEKLLEHGPPTWRLPQPECDKVTAEIRRTPRSSSK